MVSLSNTSFSGINGTFYNLKGKDIYGIAIQDNKELVTNAYVSNFNGLKRGTIWFDGNNCNIDMIYNTRSEVHTSLIWGVSGISLYPIYNPKKEGFTGVYSDVLRATAHTAIGFKNNKVYLIVSNKNLSMDSFRSGLLNSKIAFDGLIALDGGGSTQMKFNGKDIVKSVRKLNHFIKVV